MIQFDPAGYGVAIRDSEVAKAWWSQGAKQARSARRAAKRGRFVRNYTAPAREQAEEMIRQAEEAADRQTRVGSRRLALGLAGGLGGGLTLGELGRTAVQRQNERHPVRKADHAQGEYPYLLPNIRYETQTGIPATRSNPISPLQLIAASDIIAEGTAKVRSLNPLFRRRRTQAGMRQITSGTQMLYRGVGEPT